MKIFRSVFCLLFLCLIALPINAHGQENVSVDKNLTSKVSTSTAPDSSPRKSLSGTQSYSPSDYPLVTAGSYAGYLLDSWYTNHDITFEMVSNYSTYDMNVQILYASDYSYAKDGIITVEFLKDTGGTLEYIDSTEFDTYGYTNVRLNSLVSKSYYQNQQYIYLRVGATEYSDDYYYADVIQFKVSNPFYTPPVVDTTAPAKPVVNIVSNNSTSVTGKTEASATLTVKKGTTTIGTGTANSDGTFAVTIPKQIAGTKLTVYSKDKAGNTSYGTTITVIDKIAPLKPTVNSIGDNQTIITKNRGRFSSRSKTRHYCLRSNYCI
jgi:hypothetical protein